MAIAVSALVEEQEDISGLRRLLEDHVKYTGSATADRALGDWDTMLTRFVKVMPREYKRALAERAAAANGSKLAEVAGNG